MGPSHTAILLVSVILTPIPMYGAREPIAAETSKQNQTNRTTYSVKCHVIIFTLDCVIIISMRFSP